jgi:hypothetical protein
MSTRDISCGIKAVGATFMCLLSRNPQNFHLFEPSELVYACIGIDSALIRN